MKLCSTSLLLLALLLCLQVPAQYLAFPDTGAVWKVDEFNSDILIGCGGTLTTIYGVQDTIVRNGTTYQKIEVFTNAICTNGACFGLGQMEGIRTDTATGIVYGWNWGQEVPLFDYSLQAGDTMWTYDGSFWWGATTVVDSVDTVVLGGLSRKRLFISNYLSAQEFIIEGVGPSTGLFVPPGNGVNGERGQLACYSESGVSIYSDPNSCSSGAACTAVSREAPPSQASLVLAPNPARDVLRIQLEGHTLHGIRLHDVFGRELWQAMGLQAHGEYQLDLATVAPGVYLLELEVEGYERLLVARFVKR